MTASSQLILPFTVSASDEVQSSQLSTRPSAKQNLWPGGFYEIQQGSSRQRNEKQGTKRKKTPRMRIALGPVIPCMIVFHKEWQQLPANLLCILLIPHWHNCQNITRQFHPHRRSLYLSQWARLNEVISHEFWQRLAEKSSAKNIQKTWRWLLLLLLLLFMFNFTHKLPASNEKSFKQSTCVFCGRRPISPEKCASPQARKHQNPHRSEP